MPSFFMLGLCALCSPFALAELLPTSMSMQAAMTGEPQSSSSLKLLQRTALSFTQAGSSVEVAPPQKPRTALVTHYNDSACTIPEGSAMNVSAETDVCLLNWNYTCGCSSSGEKLVIGYHMKYGCNNPSVHHLREIPVGRCMPGRFSDSGADVYMKVDDFGTCPCCGSTCSVYGDPHIMVFDQAEVALLNVDSRGADDENDSFEYGDFWLVKSERISVQARYRKVVYPKAKLQGHSYLTGVAIGGPFLEGNILLIGPRDTGKVQVVNKLGEVNEILKDGGMYRDDDGDLIEAHYREHAIMVKDRTETTPGIYVHLPNGVKVEVNRFGKHIDFAITMSPEAAGDKGMDGQCGNFNGDASDDSASLITARMGYIIPEDELMFLDEEEEDEEDTEQLMGMQGPLGLSVSVLEQGSRQSLVTPLKVFLYSDSFCENPANLSYVYLEAGPEQCEWGWNFTCSCNCSEKVVVAQHHWPACGAPSYGPDGEISTAMIKANVCQPPVSPDVLTNTSIHIPFSLATTYWRLDASTCPYCGGKSANCIVHGDPHITVFDQGMSRVLGLLATEPDSEPQVTDEDNNDMYGWGDFWLVKSEKVLIQGRYRKVFYPRAVEPLNHTYLTSVAVSGPFMRGHKVIIEPRNGLVTWSSGETSQAIFGGGLGTSFEIEDVIDAKYHDRPSIVPGPKDVVPGVDLELPAGVTVMVDRFGKHLDLQISMSQTSGGPGGVDGQCGNYNGDASDDTAELIDGRIGYQVPQEESLFEKGTLEMDA